jgi:5-formyltetrahydrofolate cyclo-ligase
MLTTDLRIVKRALREEMRIKRRAAQLADPEAPLKVRDQFFAHFELPPQSVIAAYHPLPEEMDPMPLLEALVGQGHALCLPVIEAKHAPLRFRVYEIGDSLTIGPFEVMEPFAAKPEKIPSVLLMPLLAFDSKGQRLGYGGGFYDRTLSELSRKMSPPRAFGLAYAAQQVDVVPTSKFDRPLEAIVTEKGVFFVKP